MRGVAANLIEGFVVMRDARGSSAIGAVQRDAQRIEVPEPRLSAEQVRRQHEAVRVERQLEAARRARAHQCAEAGLVSGSSPPEM